jgi:hypothetical protein
MNTDEHGSRAKLGNVVAQAGSLLYRRLAVGEAWPWQCAHKFSTTFHKSRPADYQSAIQQTASLRYAPTS